jgi:hypothetical protein
MKFFSNYKLFKDVYEAGSMVSLKNPTQFFLVLSTIGWRVITLATGKGTKVAPRVRYLMNFGKYLVQMDERHGSLYVVKYLKACQLAIQKKLAGTPLRSFKQIEPTLNFPRLSRSGLPVIIGTADRRAISAGSTSTIRLYLSLFGLYRIISAPSQLKLNTITDVFSGNLLYLEALSDGSYGTWFRDLLPKGLPKMELEAKEYIPIMKASPNGEMSWRAAVIEARIWTSWDFKPLMVFLRRYAALTRSIPLYILLVDTGASFSSARSSELLTWPEKLVLESTLGQLQFKEEAAGKLRTFAMVDGWTQSFLSPLHQYLFSILRTLPNDGTFDQEASFERAVDKAARFKCCFGFDLSSATDRLPVSLQASLIDSLTKIPGLGEAWRQLLVFRDYHVPKGKYGDTPIRVKYSVGQPMGALSSWAMLAITHHFILQRAANMFSKTSSWSEMYEVLGDDVVIFDRDLAYNYQTLCKELGVEINLSKSVVALSSPVVEYAKRTSYMGVDVSAISWKQLFSQNSLRGRISIGLSLLNRRKAMKPIGLFWLAFRGNPWTKFVTNEYFFKLSLLSLIVQMVKRKDLEISYLLVMLLDPPGGYSLGRIIEYMTPAYLIQTVVFFFKGGRRRDMAVPVLPNKDWSYYWRLLPHLELELESRVARLLDWFERDGSYDRAVEGVAYSWIKPERATSLEPHQVTAVDNLALSLFPRPISSVLKVADESERLSGSISSDMDQLASLEAAKQRFEIFKVTGLNRKQLIPNDIQVLEFINMGVRRLLAYEWGAYQPPSPETRYQRTRFNPKIAKSLVLFDRRPVRTHIPQPLLPSYVSYIGEVLGRDYFFWWDPPLTLLFTILWPYLKLLRFFVYGYILYIWAVSDSIPDSVVAFDPEETHSSFLTMLSVFLFAAVFWLLLSFSDNGGRLPLILAGEISATDGLAMARPVISYNRVHAVIRSPEIAHGWNEYWDPHL